MILRMLPVLFAAIAFAPSPVNAADTPALVSLSSAIEAALAANIDVVTARNAARSAAAGVRSANTFPNPVLSLGSTGLRPNHFGRDALSQIGDDVFRIDQTIERGGKRRLRTAAAKALLQAAGSDVADIARMVRADVTGAWVDLMAAELRAKLYANIAESYRQSQQLAERRTQAGAISVGDLARQRTEMLRAQSDLSKATSGRREAQLALAVIIGREADAATLQTLGNWQTPRPPLENNIDAIVDARPDVRAADARVTATTRAYEGARALRHSDVSVGAQYEYAGNGAGSSIGIGVSIPLLVGNRYSGEIDSASVDSNQAQANSAKLRAIAFAEIMTARRGAEDATARRASYDDDLLPSARKAASTAEFAYARGALGLVDLLDARRTLQSIELAAIDAHSDEAKALARQQAAETPEEIS
jgi:cobalt-zinc-cadmium efflux system outer membrane protein